MLVWSGAEVLSRLLATTTRKNHLVAIPSRNTYSQNLLAKFTRKNHFRYDRERALQKFGN